ncbi:hypothetical protein J2S74_002196 [Evansella vedderi]|uniref:Uncharacterized protein n=1 Tax=Evansella vedderi TaxID=38282 RepID=A0ABT9ZVQ2_9BACI|nr:CBO0543 family protein [Evansella vedderi]MDQ0254817.1 hypothetical protein [Evansella vedderi]
MIHLFFALFTIGVAWKWGDWRKWRLYLPTIQYFIIGDLLYNLFTWEYTLWWYPHPANLLPNHLLNNLFIMFTLYPSTLLVFLYHFPKKNRIHQILHLLGWIIFWVIFEFFMVFKGQCVYENGWSFGWSIAFATIMVTMLALHHNRPMLAYIFSIPITLFLLWWFQVPVLQAK